MATKRYPLLGRGLEMQCDLFALRRLRRPLEGAGGTGREVQEAGGAAGGQREGKGSSEKAESGREM